MVGAAGTFTVTTTGSPTPSLSESGALPAGVTFVDNGNGTATLSGTPVSGSNGTYSLTFTANNGVGGPQTQSFTLTVNQSPTFSSPNSTTFTVGTAGTFSVTASGVPTPSLSESGALPAGVTFTDNGDGTAALAGAPASGTAGVYSLTLTANNGMGSPTSQTFTLTVASGSTSGSSIAFVQVSSAVPQQGAQVTATFAKAQTAGDLNVVAVGWNDATAQVTSVTDSMGNPYTLAVGPTVQTGTATQAIYYAKNIFAASANGNTITVAFNTVAKYPDLRVAEYSGIDPTNPVDVVSAAQGTGTLSSSGSMTTTNANDLLVGADLVQDQTFGGGAGYTSRVLTSPDGDILEDEIVTMSGSYSATAQSNGNAWIMQMVAFRAAGSAAGAAPAGPPSVHIDTPASGATVSGTVGIWGWAVDAYAGGTAISNVQIQVDGVAVGTAAYGSSRPDVCSTYTGCPNVGFSFSLNTSSLAAGTHTITAIATDSNANPDTGSSSITVNVQAGPPSVHIDTPASGATVSGTVGIWGWAVDAFAGGTAISNVQIQVDGVAVGTAAYGSSRPDVCSTYTSCPNVGFSFSLNASSLGSGTHTITAIATDSNANPDMDSFSANISVSE